jgi:D-inositol-3-phosphate glycosyltransferase
MKQPSQIGEGDVGRQKLQGSSRLPMRDTASEVRVSLLTGGIDKPYTFGLAMELISKGASLEVIGSDSLDFPEFHGNPRLNFLNLQGSQRPDVSSLKKVFRLLTYYARLVRYAVTAKPKIFHILWNNKFVLVDRTLLTVLFRVLGKRIVLTVHNVNAARRDSKDTYLNRATLRIQYRLANSILVHTEEMKNEIIRDFGVQGPRVTVIPFGINNAVPNTQLTPGEAKERLGIRADEKTILFFGRITPYKGLDYLVSAFQAVRTGRDCYRLIIAGRPENNCQKYWRSILDGIKEDIRTGQILVRAHHIPDDETEIYFKAADVLVLPYRSIYQSGVLFLGYSFGLPVIAADVGSLKEEVVEGQTGFMVEPESPTALARAIKLYFESELFANLSSRREAIRNAAIKKHSWDVVGQITMSVYADLLRIPASGELSNHDESRAST